MSVYVTGLLEAKEYDFGSSAVHALSGLLLTSMALVLFAAVSYQCAATWKWLKTLGMSEEEAQEGCPDGVKQSSIRISHSLPDLQQEPTRHEYVQEKDNKKVSNWTFFYKTLFLLTMKAPAVEITVSLCFGFY